MGKNRYFLIDFQGETRSDPAGPLDLVVWDRYKWSQSGPLTERRALELVREAYGGTLANIRVTGTREVRLTPEQQLAIVWIAV